MPNYVTQLTESVFSSQSFLSPGCLPAPLASTPAVPSAVVFSLKWERSKRFTRAVYSRTRAWESGSRRNIKAVWNRWRNLLRYVAHSGSSRKRKRLGVYRTVCIPRSPECGTLRPDQNLIRCDPLEASNLVTLHAISTIRHSNSRWSFRRWRRTNAICP